MKANGEWWVKYGKRESIVEVFVANDIKWVREIWPDLEPRYFATMLEGAGYTFLDREVAWVAETVDALTQ